MSNANRFEMSHSLHDAVGGARAAWVRLATLAVLLALGAVPPVAAAPWLQDSDPPPTIAELAPLQADPVFGNADIAEQALAMLLVDAEPTAPGLPAATDPPLPDDPDSAAIAPAPVRAALLALSEPPPWPLLLPAAVPVLVLLLLRWRRWAQRRRHANRRHHGPRARTLHRAHS